MYLGLRETTLTGEWTKLHNEEFSCLYSLPNIVRVVKSRRMRWVEHGAGERRGEVCTGFWWGNLKERDHLGRPKWEDNIKMDLQEVGGVLLSVCSGLRIGTGGGHL